MQLQFGTDASIHGDERLAEIAEDIVTSALGHHGGRLARVEVYLADANAAKGGPDDDILCTVGARPEGLQPMVTTQFDADLEAALRGAVRKMRRALDSQVDDLSRH
ncbi:MAG: HPF/RaiA family ribosome-associated protein [Roseicyclus sp.]